MLAGGEIQGSFRFPSWRGSTGEEADLQRDQWLYWPIDVQLAVLFRHAWPNGDKTEAIAHYQLDPSHQGLLSVS